MVKKKGGKPQQSEAGPSQTSGQQQPPAQQPPSGPRQSGPQQFVPRGQGPSHQQGPPHQQGPRDQGPPHQRGPHGQGPPYQQGPHGQGPPHQQRPHVQVPPHHQDPLGQGPPSGGRGQRPPSRGRGQGPPSGGQGQRFPRPQSPQQYTSGQGPPPGGWGPRGPRPQSPGHQPGAPSQQSLPQVPAAHPTGAPAPVWGQKPKQLPPASVQSAPMAKQPSQPPEDVPQPLPTDAPGKKKKGKGKGQESQLPAGPSSAPVSAPPEKKKGMGRGQETQPTASPSSAPVSTPPDVGGLVKKTGEMALKVYQLPLRNKQMTHDRGNHVMKKFTLEVNYLPLKIKNPQLKIYHYDVNFNPETPKFLLRKALEEIRRKHFPDRHPAFDGRKNMYVAGTELSRNSYTDNVSVMNHESGKEKDFVITIKKVNDLSIAKLFEYCQRGITSNIPQTEIQATDIALRSGLTDRLTPAGRSYFSRPMDVQPKILGDGMELWHGFYQSAVMASQPYLNIDVANKAFPIQQRVLDYMRTEMQFDDRNPRATLEPWQKQNLERFLKGLKIEYAMPAARGGAIQRRIYKVTGLGGTPYQERFSMKEGDRQICVGEYYEREKNYRIQFRELPLLKIGNQGSMVPLELCTIIGNQAVMRKLDENQTANMVKEAAKPTFERKRRIDNNIRLARFNDNPTLREFGIEVQTNFEKVDAIVIKPPRIAYKNGEVEPRDGVWRQDRDNFRVACTMPTWAILNLGRAYEDQLRNFERMLIQEGGKLGIRVPPCAHIESENRRVDERSLSNLFNNCIRKNVEWVIVILSQADDIYGQVKRVSELQVGILTQCIKSRTMQRMNPMTVINILLKINSKLRGVNHCISPMMKPEIMARPFMFVGADVTHPAPGTGAEGTPSIAAVAASHDPAGFQYKMMYQLQPSREEMITGIAEIMEEMLHSFMKVNNGRYPERILYFRDGVSEGQFQQVLQNELEGIKRACYRVRPEQPVAVTFVVVQKRHHTRFFPNERDGDRRNCNVPAGTLVDSKITHPNEVDFYLVSHQSIQGTARPTKYHLLYDENNINQIDLEKLTYYLCHLFSRCMRAVSYPAPTYYAHLAAFRAKAWWDRMRPNMADLGNDQRQRGIIKPAITEKFPMFFV